MATRKKEHDDEADDGQEKDANSTHEISRLKARVAELEGKATVLDDEAYVELIATIVEKLTPAQQRLLKKRLGS